MGQDFTLRDARVLLPGENDREPRDLVFRQGRFAYARSTPCAGAARVFVTPGFWDAHLHLLQVGLRRQRLDLSRSRSLAEALSMLEAFAQQRREVPVIWAEGWDHSTWSEGRLPQREEIDQVVADRPVVMRRVCGHLAVLNSPGLAAASACWRELPASGVVTELQAMGLAALWPSGPAERERALREAQDEALHLGIVRVSEMGGEGTADAYLELQKRGALRLDVRLYLKPTQIDVAVQLRREGWLDRGRLHLGGIKLFADGSIGARTAALKEPYADSPGLGKLLYADDELYSLLDRCVDEELPVAVHAIGDAAVEQVILQGERLAEVRGRPPSGWVSLEHGELLPPHGLERLAALGIHMSMQPNFVARWGHPGGLYERALGSARWERMNPLRAVLDAELPLRFGSDGMPMDPALGLHGAVHHPVPALGLTCADALWTYFGCHSGLGNRWHPGEDWPPGADSAVLYDADPHLLAEGDISRVPVRGLLWRGEWVVPLAEELMSRGIVHVE